MKKIFLLLLLILFVLLAPPSFAQAPLPPTPAYWQTQDSFFQNLDKRKITTGVLYDRVFIWANVHLLEAGDTITYSFAQQAWHELYLATYVPTGLLPVDSLWMRATMNKLRSNVLSVGCINYQFQMIDSNAANGGRLVIGRDSLFYDGSGGSPYNLVAKAFPVVTANEIRDTLTTFYFDSTLQLNNVSGEYATAITLKNSTGDSIRLTPGAQGVLNFGKQALDTNAIILTTIVYFNTGRKVGYGILLRNNLPKFTVYDPDGRYTCVSADKIPIASTEDLKFKGYDETVATQGIGEYKIYYHLNDMSGTACDQHILKPIIILDGFDPKNDERKTPDDIYALLHYPGSAIGLGAELRLPDAGGNPGFDIIVLNFPQYIVPGSGPGTGGYRDGGADYIERNAMVLVKLIQDINDQLAANGSTEKIVVIGPSMGGLISRYALKYMENKNALGVPKMNHNCRLWVSFDAPHLGANIPLGLQSLIWFSGYQVNDAGSKKSFDEKLRSYAARQMLIYQTGGNVYSGGNNYIYFSEPMRATWQNTINSMGYPTNPRKVSLINGTTGGNWETPCKTEIQYFARKHAWPLKGMRLIELKASFYPDYGQNCEFFYGYKRGKAALSASINNTDVRGSLDIVPGGLFNTNEIVKDGLDPVLGKFYTKVNILDQRVYADGTLEKYAGPYHTFIPSVSSLGFYNSNFHWANNIGNRNLVCTGEIPFDNYFTAKSNETHVSISEAAAKWITEEIRYGQPGCLPFCAQTITGSSCNKSTASYSVDMLPPSGVTLNWTATGSITIPGSATGNTVSVSKTGSGGDGFLTVTFDNHNCGANVTLSKRISTANPHSAAFSLTNATPNGCTLKGVANSYADEVYHWENGDGTQRSGYELNVSPLPIYINNQAGNFIALQMENQCGMSAKTTKPAPGKPGCMVERPGPGASEDTTVVAGQLAVFPNPTNGIWQFFVPAGKGPQTIKINDASGRRVHEQSLGGKQRFEINARNFPPGIYVAVIRFSDGSLKMIKIARQ